MWVVVFVLSLDSGGESGGGCIAACAARGVLTKLEGNRKSKRVVREEIRCELEGNNFNIHSWLQEVRDWDTPVSVEQKIRKKINKKKGNDKLRVSIDLIVTKRCIEAGFSLTQAKYGLIRYGYIASLWSSYIRSQRIQKKTAIKRNVKSYLVTVCSVDPRSCALKGVQKALKGVVDKSRRKIIVERQFNRRGISPSCNDWVFLSRLPRQGEDNLVIISRNVARSPTYIKEYIEHECNADVIFCCESVHVQNRNNLGLSQDWFVTSAVRKGKENINGGGVCFVANSRVASWNDVPNIKRHGGVGNENGAEWCCARGDFIDGISAIMCISIYFSPQFTAHNKFSIKNALIDLANQICVEVDGKCSHVLIGGDFNVDFDKIRRRPSDVAFIEAWDAFTNIITEKQGTVKRIAPIENSKTRGNNTLDYIFSVTFDINNNLNNISPKFFNCKVLDSTADHGVIHIKMGLSESIVSSLQASTKKVYGVNFNRILNCDKKRGEFIKKVCLSLCGSNEGKSDVSIDLLIQKICQIGMVIGGPIKKIYIRSGVSSGRPWENELTKAALKKMRLARNKYSTKKRYLSDNRCEFDEVETFKQRYKKALKDFYCTVKKTKDDWKCKKYDNWSKNTSDGLKECYNWVKLSRRISNSRATGHSPEAMNSAWEKVISAEPPMSCDPINRAEKVIQLIKEFKVRSRIMYGNLSQFFTWNEIINSIKSLPYGKAPGFDGIPNEIWKVFIEVNNTHSIKILSYLRSVLSYAFNDPSILKKHKVSEVALFMKCPLPDLLDFRPITLLPTITKLLETLIKVRIQKLENLNKHCVDQEQGGFANRRGCSEQSLGLSAIIDAAASQGNNIICVFLDLRKAFDTMSVVTMIEEMLRSPGVYDVTTVSFMFEWLQGHRRILRLGNDGRVVDGDKGLSVKNGVPQGGVTSSIVFNTSMRSLVRYLNVILCKYFSDKNVCNGLNNVIVKRENISAEDRINNGWRYTFSVNGKFLFTLLYADDIVIYADSIEMVQLMVNACNDWATKVAGMVFGISKCKALVAGAKIKDATVAWPRITMGGKTLEVVRSFEYLGCLVWDAHVYKDDHSNNNGCVVGRDGKKILKNLNMFQNLRWLFDSRKGIPMSISSTVAFSLLSSSLFGSDVVCDSKNMKSIRKTVRVAARSVMGAYARSNVDRMCAILGWPRPEVIVANRCLSLFIRVVESKVEYTRALSNYIAELGMRCSWFNRCCNLFVVFGIFQSINDAINAMVLMLKHSPISCILINLIKSVLSARKLARKSGKAAALTFARFEAVVVCRFGDRSMHPYWSNFGIKCRLCNSHIERGGEFVYKCDDQVVKVIIDQSSKQFYLACLEAKTVLSVSDCLDACKSMIAWPAYWDLSTISKWVNKRTYKGLNFGVNSEDRITFLKVISRIICIAQKRITGRLDSVVSTNIKVTEDESDVCCMNVNELPGCVDFNDARDRVAAVEILSKTQIEYGTQLSLLSSINLGDGIEKSNIDLFNAVVLNRFNSFGINTEINNCINIDDALVSDDDDDFLYERTL